MSSSLQGLRNALPLLVFSSVLLILVFLGYTDQVEEILPEQEELKAAFDDESAKSILIYNAKPGGSFRAGVGGDAGRRPFAEYGCQELNCIVTTNRSLLGSVTKFDAIVFVLNNKFRFPKRRSPHQHYVMFMMESPLYTNAAKFPADGVFNWTMTYRRDSDVPRPYGWIEPIVRGQDRTFPAPRSNEALPSWPPYDEQAFARSLRRRPDREDVLRLASRPRLVGWVASHCYTRSRRETYVQRLRKLIQVDVMGECGGIKCDKNVLGEDNCTAALARHYKFYLSFENSLCDEYVTEKFWMRLQQPIVPIVMGSANYTALAPPHSHLNIKDYASPKELVKHLRYLDRNPTAYLSYFWWRDKFRSVRGGQSSLCELCRKLQDKEEASSSSSSSSDGFDLRRWWFGPGRCNRKGWEYTKNVFSDT